MRKLLVGVGSVCFVGAAAAAAMRIPAVRVRVLETVLPLTARLSVHPLGNGVYWISGGISNTGFVVGDTGVIAFDAQMFLPTARRQLEEIAKITPKPVNVMVLSHSDPDHVNGLPAYPRGMQVIAQENANAEMRKALQDPDPADFPPDPAMRDYMPNRIVQDTETMVLDGVPVMLIHTASAHTDGDLVLYLPTHKIVFAGDLVTPAIGLYPGIHPNKNGTSLGWIQMMKTILALDADVYISGHGEPLDKATLIGRVQLAEERRAEIKTMFDEGKSLKEIKVALKDTPLKGTARQFPTFVETTFEELLRIR